MDGHNRQRVLLAAGAIMFMAGVALVLGLNGGHVPLLWIGVVAAVVGLAGVVAGSVREQAPQMMLPTRELEVAGVVLALVLPVGGLIAGAVLLPRRASSGVAVMLLSAFSAVVWALLVVLVVSR